MNIKSAVVLCLLGTTVNGWTPCSPKRIIKRSIRKSFRKGFQKGALVGGVVAGGAVLIAGTGAVGAAAAFDRIANDREVYEPAPGSMNGRVVLITGGSSGLGLETAKRLAAAGATIVLTSRTEAGGREAVRAVSEHLVGKEGVDASDVYSLALDLDDLSDVKRFAGAYESLGLGDVSALINNAGVMAMPSRELTVDGCERTFQSNHLGHFVLTAELFPFLSRDGARVINVSSSASNLAAPGLDIDNLNGEKSYGAWSSYGASKLANILFTRELQRRANTEGLDWLTAVSLHPGVVNTDLWRYIVGEERLKEIKSKDALSIESLALSATSLLTKTPEQGASTQVYLAADDDLVKGAFYEEMKEKTYLPKFAKDEDKAKTLWEVSEKLGAVKFDLGGAVESSDVAGVPEEPSLDEDEANTDPALESEEEANTSEGN